MEILLLELLNNTWLSRFQILIFEIFELSYKTITLSN